MPRRMLVIGLDAADLDVVRPLIEAGRMPHVGRLLEEGTSGVLRSTVPPVSAPAWASFLTGRSPGRHGLYAFVVERPGQSSTQLANLGDIHGPKIWDLAASQGVRPVVLNIPVTWPVPAVDGTIVSGMLTPETGDVQFTHPPELADEIRTAVPGYKIDVDRGQIDDEDRDRLFDAMLDMTAKRKDLFLHLLRTQEWGLFVCAFTNTDRVQHSFWRRDRAKVDTFFEAVDAHVGELLAAVDRDETDVFLMSDHGFQGARWKLHVNRYLEERGLLTTRRTHESDPHYDRRRPDYFQEFQGGQGEKAQPGALGKVLAKVGVGGKAAIDWDRTQAFLWSLDTGGVAVNLKSRYSHGSVEDADYDRVRDQVIEALRSLVMPDGSPAFRSVRRREDVYDGDFVHLAPDVVVEPHDSVAFGMRLDAREAVRAHKRPEGHHSPRGMYCLAGPSFKVGAELKADLIDCTPTILHTLGLGVPEGCDGQVIEGAFREPRDVRRIPDPVPAAEGAEPAYSAEEEEELRRSLEGLGYL